MTTDINSRTSALLQDMTRLISDSGLPPCVVGLALDRLRARVELLEAQAIRTEQQQRQAERPDRQEGTL